MIVCMHLSGNYALYFYIPCCLCQIIWYIFDISQRKGDSDFGFWDDFLLWLMAYLDTCVWVSLCARGWAIIRVFGWSKVQIIKLRKGIGLSMFSYGQHINQDSTCSSDVRVLRVHTGLAAILNKTCWEFQSIWANRTDLTGKMVSFQLGFQCK